LGDQARNCGEEDEGMRLRAEKGKRKRLRGRGRAEEVEGKRLTE
jgi:hypothetical protein